MTMAVPREPLHAARETAPQPPAWWWWPVASVLATTALLLVACASGGGQADAYQAFLQKIAADCKPLIIGNDDIGQAIVFNGLGAVPENYNNFLGKTSALYAGSISPDLYRASLNTFLGGGSYNQRSFDCIIAHLPAVTPASGTAK